MTYQRTPQQLKENAQLFWPEDLKREISATSKIPILIDTHEQFLHIISVEVDDINCFFSIVDSAKMSANLFLLHLMVLSDTGGEFLQRINSEFSTLFPEKRMEFTWMGKDEIWEFRELPVRSLTNLRMRISGTQVFDKYPLSDFYKDIIVLLMFGSTCKRSSTADILTRCEVGSLLGLDGELEKYVKQRYIHVSRITGGARANDLGQIVQRKVIEALERNLRFKLRIATNGKIPDIYSEEGDDGARTLTTFDIVLTDGVDKYIAIEVSFQVTTNSTIERKAGQAMSRYRQINEKGYKIAYVLDGAGNFQRNSALSRICNYSHCNVAYSNEEFERLAQFINEYIEQ